VQVYHEQISWTGCSTMHGKENIEMAYSKPVLLAGNATTRRVLAMCPPKLTCVTACQSRQ
jgi:hypothetical protein